MHNALPLIDFTFRDLPWRWRLRRNLYRQEMWEEFPQYAISDIEAMEDAVDRALDQIIWEGTNIFDHIRFQLNAYGQSPDPADAVKHRMLSKAIETTFAGHTATLDLVPRWNAYAAHVTRIDNGSELVIFEAESDEMAMDLMLGALLKMDEHKRVWPNFLWNLDGLIYRKDGGYWRGINHADRDLTDDFWKMAKGLVPRKAFKEKA